MKKLILLLAIVISGCGATPDSEAYVSNGWGAADIKLVSLSDGTRCAVLVGTYKGAISCNWK